jgi:DNA-binding IclR family transcriptional regulator
MTGLEALEHLASQPLSAPQLAAALRVHPRTARRLLHRLRADGYVARTEDRRRLYAPTLRVVALATRVLDGARLTQLAAPVVRRLHADSGLDAHLMVPSYRSVVCVVHDADRPGFEEIAPAHATAAGRALLAYRHAWRDSVLAGTDSSHLRAECDAIRVRGYAIESGEHRAGVHGVAAPVFGAGGEAIAALGVSGPAAAGIAPAVAALVVDAARALSAAVADA